MRYSAIQRTIGAHIEVGDTKSIAHITGSPGCGKTALVYELAKLYGFDNFIDINASLLDYPDLAGLALLSDTSSDVLKFKYSPIMAPLREGRNLVLFDEVADAPMLMQNLVRRVVWTREINGLRVSPQTYFVLASNRTIDKSGANRVSGKLKNVVAHYPMESNLEDWVNWAQRANIDPKLIQFLRFRPANLDQYDPDKESSPTPRQWEMVNYVPDTLPSELYFADCAARVGEGPAAEWTAFRKIYESIISPEEVILNPDGVKIPEDLSAQFAIVGSISQHTTPGNIDRIARFVKRLTPDFNVMYWMDTIKKEPKLKATKPFIEWSTSSGNVVLN